MGLQQPMGGPCCCCPVVLSWWQAPLHGIVQGQQWEPLLWRWVWVLGAMRALHLKMRASALQPRQAH
jgi:hypothetical protein